jgi:hypothetical protein
MFKKLVCVALLVLINLSFIMTANEGKTQNPRFTVSGDCVNDNLTGLMWAKNGNLTNGPRDWQGALDYVASMNSGSGLCGYMDWRLPNMNELESLINASGDDRATWFNTQGFNNVLSEYYWSSSEYPANTDLYAWAVPMWKFWTANIRKLQKSCYVLPVRSGK